MIPNNPEDFQSPEHLDWWQAQNHCLLLAYQELERIYQPVVDGQPEQFNLHDYQWAVHLIRLTDDVLRDIQHAVQRPAFVKLNPHLAQPVAAETDRIAELLDGLREKVKWLLPTPPSWQKHAGTLDGEAKVQRSDPAPTSSDAVASTAPNNGGDSVPPDFTTRDEANTLVAWAFRNGPLERLHIGEYSPLLEDRSLSRITGTEMKELMLSACRQLAKLMRLKERDPAEYYRQVLKYNQDYCSKWER